MTDAERRLKWPYKTDHITPTDWIVPNTPGEFTLTGYLFKEELEEIKT